MEVVPLADSEAWTPRKGYAPVLRLKVGFTIFYICFNQLWFQLSVFGSGMVQP